MPDPHLVFVAYPSRDQNLLTVIREGLARASAKLNSIRFEPWEFNDVVGTPIISPVINKIEQSSFIVADISYLNLNVVYEIGYAIGKKKRVFLIRHTGTAGDKDLANRVGIFDTVGYAEYSDSDALAYRLTGYIEQKPLEFTGIIDNKAPVYVVEPPQKGDAATMMTSRLKKTRYRYRSFNPSEDSRLSATDAIKQVSSSAGVMVSFESDAREWANVHNIRTMFVAGLADGMEKPCLILAPAGFTVPLDVRDDAKHYTHPDDIAEHVASFALELTEHLQLVETPLKASLNSLQNMTFGDPTAENEMTTLGAYYMQTEQFTRAVRGEVNLVVGRKGAGKTALFLQLRDRIRADKRNVMVDLKPEGYQLIKLKEDLLSYLTEGARQHLITAFWEYLLLLEVTYKVLEKDRTTHKHNHEIYEKYLDLEATYKVENFSSEGDFSERLLGVSNRIASSYRARFGEVPDVKLTVEDVTSLVHAHDIRLLRKKLSDYLNTKQSVWILFDNLDKGWNTRGVDEIDIIVLRCLVEAGRKIEREMRKNEHELYCVIFVRNDVYELLMKGSADYGKDMRAVLDWTDPDMLREMLRLRLVSGMNEVDSNVTFEKIWRDICVSHYHGEDTSAYFIERSLMRPRNVLKIFAHSKGFAINFNHSKIEESDIEKGIKAFSQDLLIELDHELSDVCPDVPDLLYHFIDQPSEVSKFDLMSTLTSGGVGADQLEKVFIFLLYYGVIGLKTETGVQYIFDVSYDSKILTTRAQRLGENARYVFNPAFWDALGIIG
ncbi:P-loop ATPase, Sll1717 family [Undibacterium sp. Ji42W]|uniref:P-loop ATPase, Sll1717 family n=1 Tax=Undibacterium sp. Ji42W TaxID=3413039 RepID=UPI003BEFB481